MYFSMLTAGNIGTSNANASNKFVTMAKMLHRIKTKTTTISIIAKFCCSFSSNLSLEQEKKIWCIHMGLANVSKCIGIWNITIVNQRSFRKKRSLAISATLCNIVYYFWY